MTFFDSLVHWCYFVWTSSFLPKLGLPENWIQPAMSIGQIAEIFTMAWLGYFLKRLGWRRTMIIGILGHVVRFGIYSLGYYYQGNLWLWIVIFSNVVHGFAYAFFFATVYIFVDETFPKDIRTSAQSLFNLLILGLGPLLGGFLWPWLGDVLKGPEWRDPVQLAFPGSARARRGGYAHSRGGVSSRREERTGAGRGPCPCQLRRFRGLGLQLAWCVMVAGSFAAKRLRPTPSCRST